MSIAPVFCVEKKYSYQHIQGLMLLNLNTVAVELNLSHRHYRLLGILIGLWNINHNRAFPTIDYLAQNCKMAKSTILTLLKELVDLNLVVIVKHGKRNNYYFSKKLLPIDQIQQKPKISFPCKTTHDKTNKKLKLNKNNSKKINPLTVLPSKNHSNVENLLKHKYCIHKPSGKKLQIKPEMGTHLLIKYHKEYNTITFWEEGITDYVQHFKPLII